MTSTCLMHQGLVLSPDLVPVQRCAPIPGLAGALRRSCANCWALERSLHGQICSAWLAMTWKDQIRPLCGLSKRRPSAGYMSESFDQSSPTPTQSSPDLTQSNPGSDSEQCESSKLQNNPAVGGSGVPTVDQDCSAHVHAAADLTVHTGLALWQSPVPT